jgi:GNAT superfamily N-acetyltransferase
VFEDRLTVWSGRLIAPPDNQHTIIAEDDGRIAGFACTFGAEDAHWGTLLDNIHVDPERKRGGIGTLLLLESARWAQERYQDAGFYLWVLEANGSARRFYERFGARNVEEADSEPPGGGTVRGLRYAWERPADLLARAGS